MVKYVDVKDEVNGCMVGRTKQRGMWAWLCPDCGKGGLIPTGERDARQKARNHACDSDGRNDTGRDRGNEPGSDRPRGLADNEDKVTSRGPSSGGGGREGDYGHARPDLVAEILRSKRVVG